MTKLRTSCGIFLLTSTFIFFNASVYADPGQGKGHGNAMHGQGKGHNVGVGRGSAKSTHGQGHQKLQGKGNAKNINKVGKTNPAAIKNIKFASGNKAAITNFFKATPFKTGTLPPGIAMNLARGKTLPPGIAKVYLPQNLVGTLPVYPGYEYLAVGPNVILANTNTGLIADVLKNVLL